MNAQRSILAGLLLALPTAAVFAQDNPWRVPSAAGGYVPPYAVQDFDAASGYRASSPRLQTWSQQPAYGQAGRQDFEGFGRSQWRGTPGVGRGTNSGQPAFSAGPPRQAALLPQGRYDVGPTARPDPGFGQTWSGGAGYLPPSMATGSLPAGGSNRDARRPPAPITQYAPFGGYGEYPPLDEAAAVPSRSEAPAQRGSANNPLDPRGYTPSGPLLSYGPSTLTAPYGAGLPGPGGYGYGYGGLPGPYGFPGAPYPPGW